MHDDRRASRCHPLHCLSGILHISCWQSLRFHDDRRASKPTASLGQAGRQAGGQVGGWVGDRRRVCGVTPAAKGEKRVNTSAACYGLPVLCAAQHRDSSPGLFRPASCPSFCLILFCLWPILLICFPLNLHFLKCWLFCVALVFLVCVSS